MANTALLIKGGCLIDPANSREGTFDILIRNGKIEEISASGFETAGIEGELKIIDAFGCYVAPGFVDVHSHFRDPGFTGKEDIHTGALAAAAGGYTSVVLMANTFPAVDNVSVYKEVTERASSEDIRIYQSAAVTTGRAGRSLTDMEGLAGAGVRGFTDDGSPIMDEKLVIEAMKKAATLGVPLSFHEEDPEFVRTAGINAGSVAEELGIEGADRKAEISMVKRDIELALETGCSIDIQHISARESVELIRQAKKRDSKGLIHAEATPNHFSLTEEAIKRYGTNAKINPPLRTEEDRQAILKGLSDGTIDIIATDHAPHMEEEKAAGGWFASEGEYAAGRVSGQNDGKLFGKAPSGILGLETAFSLSVKSLIEPGILEWKDFIQRISLAPAKLYGLKAGALTVGEPADIVIFNDKLVTDYKYFRSRSSNSPFLGAVLPGRILYTICGGNIVYSSDNDRAAELKI